MHICKDCTHSRRGEAIDRRKAEPGRRTLPPRPSLRSGDYICSRLPIVPAPVDPQTGFQALPSGEDCRDLNPAGECENFTTGMQVGAGLTAAIVASAVIALGCLLALAQG